MSSRHSMTAAAISIGFSIVALIDAMSGTVFADPVDFARDIRPIFQKHCYSCHAASKQKSGLRLDIKSEAIKGGESYGPLVIPRKSADSPLIQAVNNTNADLKMPPEGERLSVMEIATLVRWVDEGAVWPDGVDLAKLEDKRDHWSFKPIQDPVLPAVQNEAWPRNAIDRFILARLEQTELKPTTEADRVAWIRRVSFDLIGLPPSPEQVKAFVSDTSDLAYESALDQLLKSPRYGERWAQHWLDLVRYADTHGFEVNTERPNAWPYRDYVIDSFNNDTPYDQFIREQIVGDALGKDAATGFLITASVLLPGQIGKDEPSKRLARQDSLDEIVVNIGQTFLGLSIGCARCHDHKFDPISQQEYYSMQAFVAGVEYADRELRTPEADALRLKKKNLEAEIVKIDRQLARLTPLARSGVKREPINARLNSDRFTPVTAKRLRFTILATNNLEPCVDELEVFTTSGVNIAQASEGTVIKSSGDNVSPNRHELRFINDGNYGNSRSWMSNEMGKGWVELEFVTEQMIEQVVWGRDREGKFTDRLAIDYRIEIAGSGGDFSLIADATDRQPFEPGSNKPASFSDKGLNQSDLKEANRLIAEKAAIESQIREAAVGQTAFAGTFRTPDVIRLLSRGDPEQPKEEVAPAVCQVIGSIALPGDTTEQQRRSTLAEWIANPKNPLTARVIVNRIWQGHFGIGLVETASDFGRSGTKPSHPELLDWLATEFIRSGWSIKHLHRLIVLSSTYRQSTQHNHDGAAKDADVRLLWRYPSQRLEAEMIRDSMLFVSGRLNPKTGGPGFNLFNNRGGLSGFNPVESYSGDGLRRMIYAHKVRREREAVFGAFDCPDAGQSTSRRRESTTPIQALNLFNSRFTIDESNAFAERAKSDVGDDVKRQIRRAWQLALTREPDPDEITDGETIVNEHGLSALCRVLFNSNEFLFSP